MDCAHSAPAHSYIYSKINHLLRTDGYGAIWHIQPFVFPTCQVRVCQILSELLFLLLLLLLLANPLRQPSRPSSSPAPDRCWTSQGPNAVSTAGPQPAGSERSTTGPQPGSSRAQRAALDLNRQMECQIECQNICQIECQIYVPDRMPKYMPDRMSKYMPDRMSDRGPIEC